MMNDFSGGRTRRIRPDNYATSPYLQQGGDAEALAITVDGPSSFTQPTLGGNGMGGDAANDGRGPFFKRLGGFFANLSKKQWAIAVIVVLVLTGGCAAYFGMHTDKKPVAKQTAKAVSKPAPTPPPPPTSPLTGKEVSAEDSKRPVIGVMIENSTFARPQSGLIDAGVVYEAIAEYGITRFLALFQEAAPGNIGPVRSARPYYVDWARSYEAAYAHVGGSPDALAKIRTPDQSVRDLDQFANSGAFRRISQREAPHNVYTTMQQLRELAASKGWTSSKFTSWPRKKEAPLAQQTAGKIDIAISGPTYNVHYDYDKASNSYLRVMGGAPHNDSESGKQLSPKVVIAIATPYALMADGYHSTYTVEGTGSAKIFQDGGYFDATWKRETSNSQYSFTDSAGKPIALNPGQTWVTVVGDPTAIKFTAQ